MTGIYVIIIELDRPDVLYVGKKHRFDLQKGYYAYVGSALSGLEKRLGRHLKPTKKLHWHIDYLLNIARIRNIISTETDERKECLMAHALSQRLASKDDFGCSDCNCQSHLFFCSDQKTLETSVFAAFKSLELTPIIFV